MLMEGEREEGERGERESSFVGERLMIDMR
jgi:hypothetical protein